MHPKGRSAPKEKKTFHDEGALRDVEMELGLGLDGWTPSFRFH